MARVEYVKEVSNCADFRGLKYGNVFVSGSYPSIVLCNGIGPEAVKTPLSVEEQRSFLRPDGLFVYKTSTYEKKESENSATRKFLSVKAVKTGSDAVFAFDDVEMLSFLQPCPYWTGNAFSPNGQYFVVFEGEQFFIFDTYSWKLLIKFRVTDISFKADGARLDVIIDDSATVYLMALKDPLFAWKIDVDGPLPKITGLGFADFPYPGGGGIRKLKSADISFVRASVPQSVEGLSLLDIVLNDGSIVILDFEQGCDRPLTVDRPPFDCDLLPVRKVKILQHGKKAGKSKKVEMKVKPVRAITDSLLLVREEAPFFQLIGFQKSYLVKFNDGRD